MPKTYSDSFLSIANSPENSTGELLLASAYRRFVLGISESDANELRASQPEPGSVPYFIPLRSPRRKKEPIGSTSFMPLTPSVAAFSAAARARGNPWNPGGLLANAVWLGNGSRAAFDQCSACIRELLEISDADDPWAQLVELSWRPILHERKGAARFAVAPAPAGDSSWTAGKHPGATLAADLKRLSAAKCKLTRRQLVTAVEALLRLGLTAHILWMMQLNVQCWNAARASLKEDREIGFEAMAAQRLAPCFTYGAESTRIITAEVQRYMQARIALEYLITVAGEKRLVEGELTSPHALGTVCRELARSLASSSRDRKAFWDGLQRLLHEKGDELAAEAGPGNNLKEFFRYSLAARDTLSESERGYDQSYWIKRVGVGPAARYRFEAGPVSLTTFAHCCQDSRGRLATFGRFVEHLAQYGVDARLQAASGSPLESALRRLGITLDSPDADVGMVILDPLPSGAVA
jgi:hypothetical protein